jgi:hypothetical protein
MKTKISLSESYIIHAKRSYLLQLLSRLGLKAELEYPPYEFQILGKFEVEEL